MPQDIRRFFAKPGTAPAPAAAGGSQDVENKPPHAVDKKPKQASATKVAAAPAAAAEVKAPKRSKYFSSQDDSQKASPATKKTPARAKPSTPGGAGSGGSKKRCKAVVVDDSDEDEASDDDDDSDVEVVSSDEESSEDVEDLVDSEDSEEPAPKAAKKQRTSGSGAPSPAAAKGARAKAGTGAGAGAGRKRGAKADKPAMVIEPHKRPKEEEGEAQEAGSSAKKARRMPASVAASAAAAAAGPARKKAAAAPKVELSAAAQRAVALVEAAAEALPALDEAQLSFQEGGWGAGVNPELTEPPELGSKDIPRGHPDAFTGKTFVFSGVLPCMWRDGAKELIASHGGRVTGDVSGKTSFLVLGAAGSRRKYDKAISCAGKGCRVIDEDGLLALISASIPALPAGAAAAAGASPGSAVKPDAAAGGGGAVRPVSGGAFHSSSGAAGTPVGALAAAGVLTPSSRAAGAGSSAGSSSSGATQLWVDKHKPNDSNDLVGNPGLIKTLRGWLQQWEAIHLYGAEPQPIPGAGAGKPKDLGKKAVLLSGPPGIGKTSSAHIVAKECGFDVVEVNASDTRSKADAKTAVGVAGKTSNRVKEMVDSTRLNFGGGSGSARKQVLIMDEVDGMSGGDRGGVADLMATIARSKIPIICICNDKYNQKLRSLRNKCLEMDYRRPTQQQVAKRMMAICAGEGLSLNEATMHALVEGANGDLRLILGQLQMARLRTRALSYEDVKGNLSAAKDADMSPFEAARRLLEGAVARAPLGEQVELVFQDADLVPMLVQENYVNHRPNIAGGDEGKRLRALAKAADSISAGDIVNTRVRRYQQWGLMPFGAVVGTILPCAYMRGGREIFGLHPGEMNFPRFTAWMGVNSTSTKQRRLLGELTANLAASGAVSAPRSAVRLSYVPALRAALTLPLVAQAEAAIPQLVQLMQEYCINKEQYDWLGEVTRFKTQGLWGVDPLKEVPAKTKSAFTRAFNAQGLRPRSAAMVEGAGFKKGRAKKGGRGGGAAAGAEDDEGEGEGGEEAAAPDADGGAALAEGEGGGRKREQSAEQQEEEEEDEEALAARLAKEGIALQRAVPAGGKGAGSSGRGRGRGSGAKASRGGGRSGGGGRGSGSGSGRGRGRGR